MRIGELARKAGIRASAIRFYERAGVLPRASRQNGQRDFTPETELYLAVIDFARRAGFTIAEIRLFFQGFLEGTPASAATTADGFISGPSLGHRVADQHRAIAIGHAHPQTA